MRDDLRWLAVWWAKVLTITAAALAIAFAGNLLWEWAGTWPHWVVGAIFAVGLFAVISGFALAHHREAEKAEERRRLHREQFEERESER